MTFRDPKKRAAYNHDYHKEHKVEIHERGAAYRKRNKEKIATRYRAWIQRSIHDPLTYFVQWENDPDAVKIGTTENIKDRLANMQTSNRFKLNVLFTIDGNKEAYFHDLFEEYRCHPRGEWFLLEGELAKFVDQYDAEDYEFPDVANNNGTGWLPFMGKGE